MLTNQVDLYVKNDERCAWVNVIDLSRRKQGFDPLGATNFKYLTCRHFLLVDTLLCSNANPTFFKVSVLIFA